MEDHLVVQNWCLTKPPNSQPQSTECNFLWTIDRYKDVYDTSGEILTSPKFSATSNDNYQWCIHLEPKYHSEEFSLDFVRLSLQLASIARGIETLARFQFSVLDSTRKKTNTRRSAFRKFTQGKEWHFFHFIERDILFEKETILLPGGRLTILCEIIIQPVVNSTHNTSGQSRYDIYDVIPMDIPSCNLSVDFAQLLDDQDLCDVTLVINGKEFKAHKCILAARSTVFKAMFKHDMKESNMNRVEITDIKPKVFRELLRYVYTGNVQNVEKVTFDLLAAANKYDLKRLKFICEDALCKRLSIEKAVDILIAADFHQAEKLKAVTICFIKLHSANVMSTDGWKNLFINHPNLIADIRTAVSGIEMNKIQLECNT